MRFWKGVLITLFGASLWGVSGACSQLLFDDYGLAPAFVTFARMLSAGLVFLAIIVVKYRDQAVRLLTDKAWLLKLALFTLGMFGSQYAFLFSVEATNAGTATVLQTMSTAMIMLYACFVARKVPHAGEFAGLVLAVIATAVIATQGNWDTLVLPLAGLVWGVVNSLCIAVYMIVPVDTGLFDEFGSVLGTGIATILGSALALVACIIQQAMGSSVVAAIPGMDWVAWLALVGGVGFVGTFAAFALFLHGTNMVGPVAGGLLGAMEPVSAQVCAAVFLGTVFSSYDWLGLVLMIVMVALITVKPKEKEKPGLTNS